MICTSVAHYIGAHITKSTQLALQADGSSSLTVSGETHLNIAHDDKTFMLEALVVENLET